MSTHVTSRVKRASRSRLADRLVLLCLADNADEDGYCWPGVPTIMADANLSERQTRQSLANLEAMGEIAYIAGQGRGHMSVYVVLAGLDPNEQERRTANLEAKADEIAAALRARRERRYGTEKGQGLPLSGPKKVRNSHLLRGEKVQNTQEKVQNTARKGADEIGVLPSLMGNDALNHHDPSCDPSCIPPPPPTPLAPPIAADAAGDGGGERETLTILQQAGVVTAAEYTDIPPAVAEAAVAQSRTHQRAAEPGRLGGLVAGLLKRYRDGRWAPPPPQSEEVPDAPHDRPARRSGARPPAAERPAGSGPPPGVRTPTAEDLTAWGIGPGRPWPRE